MPAEEEKKKKKVHPGLIEADKEECAIVVHYETSEPPSGERTPHTRRLRLKTLNERSDPAKIADDVLRKCKYIPSSKRRVVEMLVANLQEHVAGDPDAAKNAAAQRSERRRRKREDDRDDVVADMDSVATPHAHGALSRVLAEDYRRSSDLAYNIVRVFLSFSNFVEMHAILAQYRVGSICVELVEFEVKRTEHRHEEARRRAGEVREAKLGLSDSREGIRDHERRVEELERTAEKEDQRSRLVQRKQDKTLYVCLHVLISVLINLAEDVLVEHKMVKRHLVEYLVAVFSHSASAPLLILAAVFLKKLTLFEENKDAMLRSNLVGRLARFAPCSSPELIIAMLRLLFNLSFDAGVRDQMVRNSFIPKLVGLLKENHKFREVSLRVLYHLSVDDRCKSMFTYTEAIPIVMQLIIKFPPNRKITRELAALAGNLSLNKHNAELMCANKGLSALVARVERTRDPLLMKVVRNLSLWTFDVQQDLEDPAKEYLQRGLWSRHVTQILGFAIETESHDLLVEVLGTLGNLTRHDLLRGATWAKYIEEFSLTGYLSKLLVPGMAQHDVVLEAVVFAGVLATERDAANAIASSSLARTFWRTARRDEILYNSRVLLDVLDCLGNGNEAVVSYANACLDLVMEHDRDETGALGELGAQVRRRRFYSHNREWLEIVEQEGAGAPTMSRTNYPSPTASDEESGSPNSGVNADVGVLSGGSGEWNTGRDDGYGQWD
ncbi:hypothetical protein JL720_3358 [Aureococcus anophagefferens]|nr:hypothetical protein JL720_3358 [Aureococcus anophagefferens]